MADKAKNVVLNFKMNGQVEYAKTIREINAIMNAAAKEYKNHVAAMGSDAKATEKLAAEKKKLEIQMEAAKKRTQMLRNQYEEMSKSTKTTTGQLAQMYNKLLDSERAEISLQRSLDRVNEGLSEQGQALREAENQLSKLADEMELLEAEQRKLSSSFELQNVSLSKNATEAEKTELAQKQLQQQMKLTEKVVRNLENQLEQAKIAYGSNSKEVLELETKLNGAKVKIQQFSHQLDNLGESSKKVGKNLDGVKSALTALAGAAPAAAIGSLASNTQELSTDLARLTTNAEMAGRDMDVVNEAFKQVAAISGEADSAVETLSNILATGFKDEQLSAVIDNINGAAIRFSDTLKTEGIADGIQETFATGEAVGQFAELLERSGIDLEKFNEGLSKAKENGEGTNYILDQMSSLGLTEVLEKYKELNPEIAEANQAQVEQQIALQELGNTLRPLVTEVAKFTTELIKWANEHPNLTKGLAIVTAGVGALVSAASLLAPILTAVGVASGGASIGIGALTTTLLPIVGVIAAVVAAIAGIILVIKNWGKITDWISEKWNQFTSWLSEITSNLASDFVNWFNNMKDGAVNEFNELKDNAISTIVSFKDNVVNKANEIKTNFVNKINDLKNGAISKFNSLRDKAGQIMQSAKDKLLSPISSARDKIRTIIDEIKGFFSNLGSKLQIKIPKPKLPHFKISGKFDLIPPDISVPKLSIDWYAKGGIFTQPTIFGYSNGRFKGAGDAGPEAALPLNEETLGAIGRGIAATMNQNKQSLVVQLVTPNGRILAEEIVDDITKLQSRRHFRARRGAGNA
ncbi:hypothetical protein [Fervidibacillus albus]|uniref:Phage tail tape measure protein n=1 Tax=Fervidibacillus albus TaxID=2980026 RepID=A0A9E8LW77_9BACI|nr:hypothetical protein [Fervidibacillus albus]WAA10843.1 hypothetical protein OE104_05890 [Fervidibacillus albus]